MPLSDDQLERYARQIIVPGIGVQGQQRLIEARVLVVGHPRGVAQTALYLRAAGATVVYDGDASPVPPAMVVVAGVDALGTDRRRQLLGCGLALCWYALEETGFTSGLHPQAPLPAEAANTWIPDAIDEGLHDAAACDAAAVACAWIAGLDGPAGPLARNLG